MEPVIVVILSKVFSSDCFSIFGFLALCCVYKSSKEKVYTYRIQKTKCQVLLYRLLKEKTA